MIIDRDSEPKNTIYYAAGCIFLILREKDLDMDDLFEEITNDYHKNMDYTIFLCGLDFLFILNKITISKKGVLSCL